MKKSLIFSDRLYIGDGIDIGKLNKLKKQIQKRPNLCNVTLICISSNTTDQLDLLESDILDQKYYRLNPPYVIGIAKDHEEALILVETIAQECLNNRGDLKLKEYLYDNCG